MFRFVTLRKNAFLQRRQGCVFCVKSGFIISLKKYKKVVDFYKR